MSAEEVERDRRVRQVRRRVWLFIAAGLTLLAGGSAAVLLLGQPVQRIVLGAVAVPLYVAFGLRSVRQAVRERREGPQPPSREAARCAPLLTLGVFLCSWGVAFAGFQAATPQPALDAALLQGAPLAVIALGGLSPVWGLRRKMNRESADPKR